ncbi:MAG: hypothetical protein R3174_08265, partial [Gammaproteobacteria bacterium]|nr:hypothetical protein [Gammaproteobacteria bacterium]
MSESETGATDQPEAGATQHTGALPPGLAVGAGALTLLLSLPMFLLAIGVLEADEPIHWVIRILLACFTGIFLVAGSLLFFGGVYWAVNVAVPGSAPWIFRFPVMLLRRITLPGLWAAILYGLLAAQFWAMGHLPEPPFGIDDAAFHQWTTLEFISIHATAFLGTVLALPLGGVYSKIRYGIFSALLLLYTVMVLTILEPLPAVLFLYLVCAKFSDYLFHSATPEEMGRMTLRWGLMFLLFIVLIWDQALVEGPETFDVAVRYFTVLAFLELFSLTEIPILAKKPDEN